MSMIEIQYERCGRRRRGASPQIAPSGADNRVRGDQHGMAACSTFRLTRETPMTTNLRQRMTDDVQVRNLSLPTQSSYVQQVSMFARHFDKSPEVLGIEDIRNYQLYLTNQKKPNASSIKVAVSAIRFLCRVTLGRPWDFDEIVPSPRSLGPCRSFSVPKRSCIFSAVSRTHRHVEDGADARGSGQGLSRHLRRTHWRLTLPVPCLPHGHTVLLRALRPFTQVPLIIDTS